MNAEIIPFPQMSHQSFQSPTIEECQQHAAKIGLPDNEAQKFYYFYDGKDWMVGKNKMKKWRSAMAGWQIRWKEESVSKNKNQRPDRSIGTTNEGIAKQYHGIGRVKHDQNL